MSASVVTAQPHQTVDELASLARDGATFVIDDGRHDRPIAADQ